VRVLVAELPDVEPKALAEAASSLLAQLASPHGAPAAVVLGTRPTAAGATGNASFVAVFSPQVRCPNRSPPQAGAVP
jgi:hypothetical protein